MRRIKPILVSGLVAILLSNCGKKELQNNDSQGSSEEVLTRPTASLDKFWEEETPVKIPESVKNPLIRKDDTTQSREKLEPYEIDLGDGVKIAMKRSPDEKISPMDYTKKFTRNSGYEGEDLTDTHGQLFSGERRPEAFLFSEPITLRQYEQFIKKTGYEGKKDVYPGDKKEYMGYREDERAFLSDSPVYPIAYANAIAFTEHITELTKRKTSLPNAYQVLLITKGEIDERGMRKIPSIYETETNIRIKEITGEEARPIGAFIQEYIKPESVFYLTDQNRPPFTYYIGARKLDNFKKEQKSSPSGGVEYMAGPGSISKIPRMFRIVQPVD